MWNARYWPGYWPRRYWPKEGAAVPVKPPCVQVTGSGKAQAVTGSGRVVVCVGSGNGRISVTGSLNDPCSG